MTENASRAAEVVGREEERRAADLARFGVCFLPPLCLDVLPGRQNRRCWVAEQGPGAVPWDEAGSLDDTITRLGRGSDAAFVQLEGERVLAVRSVAGRVPMYLAREPDGERRPVVATTLRELFERIPRPPLDRFVAGLWATAQCAFPEGRTPFHGVLCVPRGHYALFLHGNWKVTPYWTLPASPLRRLTAAEGREHAAWLRAELIASVERQVPGDVETLLTLSGGADSSALGALAARHLGRRVHTLTFLPEADDRTRHELGFLRALEGYANFGERWAARLTPELRMGLSASVPPVPLLIPHPALGALARVLADVPVRVLVGAEWVDDLFGGKIIGADWAHHARPRDYLTGGSLESLLRRQHHPRWYRSAASFVTRRWVGRSLLPFSGEPPPFLAPELRAEQTAWRAERRTRFCSDREPWALLRERLTRDAFLAMNWEACAALRVVRALPFVTREFLEQAVAFHPTSVMSPYDDKRFFRAALEGLVPPVNLRRRDKGWERGTGFTETPDRSINPPSRFSETVLPLLDPAWLGREGPVPAWHAVLLQHLARFGTALDGTRFEGQSVTAPRGGLFKVRSWRDVTA